MAKVKVTAPNSGFNGRGVHGVTFEDGVAHVDSKNEGALAYFARHGYKVAGQDNAAQREEVHTDVPREANVHEEGNQVTEDTSLALDDFGMEELKAYASEREIDVKGHQASKDALITRIREVEDQRQNDGNANTGS